MTADDDDDDDDDKEEEEEGKKKKKKKKKQEEEEEERRSKKKQESRQAQSESIEHSERKHVGMSTPAVNAQENRGLESKLSGWGSVKGPSSSTNGAGGGTAKKVVRKKTSRLSARKLLIASEIEEKRKQLAKKRKERNRAIQLWLAISSILLSGVIIIVYFVTLKPEEPPTNEESTGELSLPQQFIHDLEREIAQSPGSCCHRDIVEYARSEIRYNLEMIGINVADKEKTLQEFMMINNRFVAGACRAITNCACEDKEFDLRNHTQVDLFQLVGTAALRNLAQNSFKIVHAIIDDKFSGSISRAVESVMKLIMQLDCGLGSDKKVFLDNVDSILGNFSESLAWDENGEPTELTMLGQSLQPRRENGVSEYDESLATMLKSVLQELNYDSGDLHPVINIGHENAEMNDVLRDVEHLNLEQADFEKLYVAAASAMSRTAWSPSSIVSLYDNPNIRPDQLNGTYARVGDKLSGEHCSRRG